MKFNYQSEKIKFEKEWARMKVTYEEAGMTQFAIRELYAYDWEMFKKERNFCVHNQYMSDELFKEGKSKDDGQNALLSRFAEQLSVRDKYFEDDPYGWIDEIDDVALLKCLKKLTSEQLELITQYVIQEKQVSDIAAFFKTSYTSVANRWSRLKRKLRNMVRENEKNIK